ncbi:MULTISPECIES: hypothetical protein [Actinocorallia]|uniref:Uncharacterized protein n=2 Tax=Actinocorallia TaxID=58108 RepID=A0ABN3UTV1_9ACTN
MLKISISSVEYLDIPVTADSEVELESLPVEIAITDANSHPGAADWQTASWQNGHARILIGPGTALELTQRRQRYLAWVRVTDTPERPVLKADGEIVTY